LCSFRLLLLQTSSITSSSSSSRNRKKRITRKQTPRLETSTPGRGEVIVVALILLQHYSTDEAPESFSVAGGMTTDERKLKLYATDKP
jgi:hypothetical protein